MDHNVLLLTLQADFSPVLAAAGIVEYAGQQDVILRAITAAHDDLGAAEDGPDLTPAQSRDLTPLVEYFVLQSLLRAAAAAVDVATADQKSAESQRFRQLTVLFDRAARLREALGYGGIDLMQVGRLNLDFLEPGR